MPTFSASSSSSFFTLIALLVGLDLLLAGSNGLVLLMLLSLATIEFSIGLSITANSLGYVSILANNNNKHTKIVPSEAAPLLVNDLSWVSSIKSPCSFFFQTEKTLPVE